MSYSVVLYLITSSMLFSTISWTFDTGVGENKRRGEISFWWWAVFYPIKKQLFPSVFFSRLERERWDLLSSKGVNLLGKYTSAVNLDMQEIVKITNNNNSNINVLPTNFDISPTLFISFYFSPVVSTAFLKQAFVRLLTPNSCHLESKLPWNDNDGKK